MCTYAKIYSLWVNSKVTLPLYWLWSVSHHNKLSLIGHKDQRKSITFTFVFVRCEQIRMDHPIVDGLPLRCTSYVTVARRWWCIDGLWLIHTNIPRNAGESETFLLFLENQHPAWLANMSGYDVNYIKCQLGNYATQQKAQASEDVGGDVNHRHR